MPPLLTSFVESFMPVILGLILSRKVLPSFTALSSNIPDVRMNGRKTDLFGPNVFRPSTA